MSRQKRAIDGGTRTPYYPGTPKQEEAKLLRLLASRFLKGTANASEVDEAARLWLKNRPDPMEWTADGVLRDREVGIEVAIRIIRRINNEVGALIEYSDGTRTWVENEEVFDA